MITPEQPEATTSSAEDRGVRGLLKRAHVVPERLDTHFSKRNEHLVQGEDAVRARRLANDLSHDQLVTNSRRVNLAWLRHGFEIDPPHFEAGSKVQKPNSVQLTDPLMDVLLHEADVASDAVMYERYNAEQDAS